jgi:putative sigma-54 modulation protein
MKLVLSAHNVPTSEAIERRIQENIDKLAQHDPRAIEARVTIEHDTTRAPEKAFKCAMRIAVPGPDLFAEDCESNLYAAIDLVTKKIDQQMRTRHSKQISKNHSEAARLKQERQDAGL